METYRMTAVGVGGGTGTVGGAAEGRQAPANPIQPNSIEPARSFFMPVIIATGPGFGQMRVGGRVSLGGFIMAGRPRRHARVSVVPDRGLSESHSTG
jgi:hypothetical protein